MCRTRLIITNVHKAAVLLGPSLVHHVYTACLHAACHTVFLAAAGKCLARTWKNCAPWARDLSAQPPLSEEEETKNVLGETQRSSKTFCLRKVGVLTVAEIISILNPTYIYH